MQLSGTVRLFSAALVAILCGACATALQRSFSENLSRAILNQNDPETVRAGAPAFLLLLDGFIDADPDDRDLLRAAADLYGVYATVFVQDAARARRLAKKSFDYARTALCQGTPGKCADLVKIYAEFVPALDGFSESDLPYLYSFATAWAGWVQTHSEDWNARADLPKIEALMQHIVHLNENYQWGRAHLYLGVLNSQLPPSLGGKPEHSREHFEKSIALSEGRDLISKVEFARRYARLVFDQGLHDRLLQEVLDADPVVPGLTLSNAIAQEEASQLLTHSSDYFGE